MATTSANASASLSASSLESPSCAHAQSHHASGTEDDWSASASTPVVTAARTCKHWRETDLDVLRLLWGTQPLWRIARQLHRTPCAVRAMAIYQRLGVNDNGRSLGSYVAAGYSRKAILAIARALEIQTRPQRASIGKPRNIVFNESDAQRIDAILRVIPDGQRVSYRWVMSEIRIGILSVAASGTPAQHRHIRALPASARPHEWVADGEGHRCQACAMMDSWPGAKYACSPAQFSGAEHERARGKRITKAEQKRRVIERLKRGQW